MTAARPSSRRGFSLVETLIAIAIMAILAMGMSAAVAITARSVEDGRSAPAESLAAREAAEQIADDVRFALRFETRTAREIAFTVPDRDGDGLPEHLRYAWSGVAGDPLVYRHNGGPDVNLLADVRSLDLGYAYRTMTGEPLPGAGPTGPVILLVVPDADSPSAEDLARTALLESWTYAVSLISASAPQGDFDAAVATADAAYVVEQAQSTALGTKLRDAPIGVVVEEAELRADFGFSANRDWPSPRTSVEIVDDTHDITSGFVPGLLAIFTSDAEVVALGGSRPDSLLVLGTHNHTGTDMPALCVIEAGGDLYGGGTAPARRVQLPWGRTGFTIGALNDDGRTIMRRSIEWVLAGAADATFGWDTAFATPVNAAHDIQVACRADLAESGTVKSISAYLDCENRDVRFAIYDDASGEPGALVVESASLSGGNSPDWQTITVADTPLAAGTYWLALALDWGTQDYFQEAGGETRYRYHDAERDGFLAAWGASDETYPIRVSIYATYTPD